MFLESLLMSMLVMVGFICVVGGTFVAIRTVVAICIRANRWLLNLETPSTSIDVAHQPDREQRP